MRNLSDFQDYLFDIKIKNWAKLVSKKQNLPQKKALDWVSKNFYGMLDYNHALRTFNNHKIPPQPRLGCLHTAKVNSKSQIFADLITIPSYCRVDNHEFYFSLRDYNTMRSKDYSFCWYLASGHLDELEYICESYENSDLTDLNPNSFGIEMPRLLANLFTQYNFEQIKNQCVWAMVHLMIVNPDKKNIVLDQADESIIDILNEIYGSYFEEVSNEIPRDIDGHHQGEYNIRTYKPLNTRMKSIHGYGFDAIMKLANRTFNSYQSGRDDEFHISYTIFHLDDHHVIKAFDLKELNIHNSSSQREQNFLSLYLQSFEKEYGPFNTILEKIQKDLEEYGPLHSKIIDGIASTINPPSCNILINSWDVVIANNSDLEFEIEIDYSAEAGSKTWSGIDTSGTAIATVSYNEIEFEVNRIDVNPNFLG